VTIAISIRLWQEQALIPAEEEGHKVVDVPIIEFSALLSVMGGLIRI